ncbi:MAG: pyridoxal phosphate-dependent aminotransferase [Bacteroidota bacterium]|nr:pyridoxal phosphate-dependent aminotransferase [Bacteroidota bacterium]
MYEPDPKGLLDTRLAVSGYYKQKGVDVNPESIVITSGSSEAYSYILKLIAEVDDEVLVPVPSYPLLSIISQLNDVVLKHYRLVYDGEWHIDFDSITSAITKKTKAILVIHPNNPTGSYVKKYEYKMLVEIAAKYNLAIISDEVFLDYAITDNEQRLESFAGKSDVLTFTISGISKMLGLPQMKIGWLIVNGPQKYCVDALSRLEMIADTYLSVSIPVQNSLRYWLNQFHHINSKILDRVKQNYFLLQGASKNNVASSVLSVEGGWNAIIKLPKIRPDDEWVENFLQNSNVLFQPGYFYDFEEDANLVMSLIQHPEVLETALNLSIFKA